MRQLYLNKYWEINEEYDIDKILYLMIDRPDEIDDEKGEYIWFNDDYDLHREYDLPAGIYYLEDDFGNVDNKMCDLYWYKNDELYRDIEYRVYDKFFKYKKLKNEISL